MADRTVGTAMPPIEVLRAARDESVRLGHGLVDDRIVRAAIDVYRQQLGTDPGYGRAIEILRDDERYRTWWTAREYPPEARYWSAEARGHLADFLQAQLRPVTTEERAARDHLESIYVTGHRNRLKGPSQLVLLCALCGTEHLTESISAAAVMATATAHVGEAVTNAD